jgi:hypothetical protein
MKSAIATLAFILFWWLVIAFFTESHNPARRPLPVRSPALQGVLPVPPVKTP